MVMMAECTNVSRVENGWLVTVYCAGTNLQLVAKTIEEVVGILKGLEWHTPRPLPAGRYDEAPTTAANVVAGR